MRKKLGRFESLLWLFIKLLLYFCLLFCFLLFLSIESHSLRRLSRTLGITVSTFCVVGLLFLQVYGKFDIGRRKSKPIIYSFVLATLCTDIITYLQLMIMRTNKPNIFEFRFYSIAALIVAYITQIIVIIVFTYLANGLFFRIHPPERCCIITSSQEALNRITKVIDKYKKQYEISKILDYHIKDWRDELIDIDTVFLYDVPNEIRSSIIDFCYAKKINIYFNPEISDVVEMNAQYYVLDDVSLLNANVKALTMEQRIMKRLLDLFLSVFLGVLSSPFLLLGAISVKLYDGGPVLFKQKRATIHGNVFEVYKLRTMKVNVENRSAEKEDDRITLPGKFLRKTRIDELPQLFNIIKGDMSFVGPRPEMLENVKAYTEEMSEFKYRMRVKAGLTGYAQISGKYNTTPRDKLIMDMMYIEKFNILRDIQIILQTPVVLLKKDSTEGFKASEKSKYKFNAADKNKKINL